MVSKADFEESVLPHMKAAFNLAFWIVRSREEAEDVVQDAFVRAFRAFSRFDGAAPKPWLLTIVRSLLQDSTIQVASAEGRVVRPWFNGRVEFAPGVKDLAAQNFALLGGRVDWVDGRRVATSSTSAGCTSSMSSCGRSTPKPTRLPTRWGGKATTPSPGPAAA